LFWAPPLRDITNLRQMAAEWSGEEETALTGTSRR
jgi:hypothetical protein